MASDLPEKVVKQIAKAGLPTGGSHPFKPKLITNAKGELIIDKQAPTKGPKSGKKGYVDEEGESGSRMPRMQGCRPIGTCRSRMEPITSASVSTVRSFKNHDRSCP